MSFNDLERGTENIDIVKQEIRGKERRSRLMLAGKSDLWLYVTGTGGVHAQKLSKVSLTLLPNTFEWECEDEDEREGWKKEQRAIQGKEEKCGGD
ncbi:predicted protein [Sclerotinia sclerotiorum 1980 UF-70]|uniref:Uncharacterized protein n=1 Tax=Sclerotinia sclerotiorum (strain ATCC 18683 / 1980 / Ss-1) TaxID=665079 RepID=A7E8E0_SCLS1|nr:predicted protein [Sclerotinia sclerotiorum 1980 UF-70]EDN96642.1 predicted protein [Sclerotinia sclerotiorum 1980 UF-70]